MIAGIFLAAGGSTRFGSPKLLHELKGKPLVCYGLESCVNSLLPEIRVVLGAEAARVRAVIETCFPAEPKIALVRNDRPERGLMSSLKTGLRSLGPRHEAAMVVLADMPCVTADLINALILEFERENAIIVPECGGTLYHPRIIPKRHFSRFVALDDDEKGSVVIDSLGADVRRVAVGGPENYLDIDRLDDLDSPRLP